MGREEPIQWPAGPPRCTHISFSQQLCDKRSTMPATPEYFWPLNKNKAGVYRYYEKDVLQCVTKHWKQTFLRNSPKRVVNFKSFRPEGRYGYNVQYAFEIIKIESCLTSVEIFKIGPSFNSLYSFNKTRHTINKTSSVHTVKCYTNYQLGRNGHALCQSY